MFWVAIKDNANSLYCLGSLFYPLDQQLKEREFPYLALKFLIYIVPGTRDKIVVWRERDLLGVKYELEFLPSPLRSFLNL